MIFNWVVLRIRALQNCLKIMVLLVDRFASNFNNKGHVVENKNSFIHFIDISLLHNCVLKIATEAHSLMKASTHTDNLEQRTVICAVCSWTDIEIPNREFLKLPERVKEGFLSLVNDT